MIATTTTATVNGTTLGTAPTLQEAQANWDANLDQGLQFYKAQMQMDRDQQALAFASNVEAKSQQMLMACIQNIR